MNPSVIGVVGMFSLYGTLLCSARRSINLTLCLCLCVCLHVCVFAKTEENAFLSFNRIGRFGGDTQLGCLPNVGFQFLIYLQFPKMCLYIGGLMLSDSPGGSTA